MTKVVRPAHTGFIITCGLLAGTGAAQEARPAAAPLSVAPAAAVDEARTLDAEVDRILTRLESREINDLQADVTWKLEDRLAGSVQTRKGRIWYRRDKPLAKFLLDFREQTFDGTRKDIEQKIVFDGEWYTELQSQTKQVSRRQIRQAGDARNPYRLGEGPFPVPFGQKKSDILREFDVIRLAPAEKDPPDTDHVKLTPRQGSQTGETYKVVHLWIAREGEVAGLPIRVTATKMDPTGTPNTEIGIDFAKPRLDQSFSPSVFKIDTPPGYEESIERLDDPPPGYGVAKEEPAPAPTPRKP